MKETKFAGYIDSIQLGDKIYKLQCGVVEIHPMICPNCGAPIKLYYGQGHCSYCDTYYTTKFSIQEINNNE